MALRRISMCLASHISRRSSAADQLADWAPILLSSGVGRPQDLDACSTSYSPAGWGLTPSAAAVAGYGKSTGRKGAKSTAHKATLALDLDAEEEQMQKAVSQLQEDMSRLHCGRAHPGLLEPIDVALSSGVHRVLRSLATVSVRTPLQLVVTAHDTADLSSIVKAISASALKLQARVENKEVVVPLPRPTSEVVTQLIKQVHTQAEQARKKVRTVRRSALEELAGQFENSGEHEAGTKMVQQLHDKYLDRIAALSKAKELELKAAGAVGDR